ncbi:FAD-dependent oxidoreductase [Planococcus sp. ISL-109]|uniref:phytoene desaturase family protein n=1 Tax=Planococcus sp. ISL-109 TaxID=2819166 RepID=UPI001BEAD548|nr:FAD-dependent oxidoreductase [Planococcus sp. ISL-109]MBT2583892.1 FAD-dependent oxidoreductase [Planococcus sp. ISL-109]
MAKRVLVVGAGIGGLTAGSLLSKEGLDVLVLEASAELGGCAGKYKRYPYLFPVGATLGMGLEPGGIHERVFRHLGKPMDIEPLERVMEMVHPTGVFTFHKNRTTHVQQLAGHFPEHRTAILSFYAELYRTARITRTLMGPLPALPPANAREWTALTLALRPVHTRLLPQFRKTLGQVLKKHGLHELHEFRHVLDGLLIDSMQTTSEDVSYLLAAVALDIYHEGAYYVPGGLYRFAEVMAQSIKENGGNVKKPRTVQTLEYRNGIWHAADQRGNSYEADAVVFNAPIQLLPELLPAPLHHQLKRPLRDGIGTATWTTLTLYLAIDTAKLRSSLPEFRQLSSGDAMDEGHHFFMSASRPDDRLRAPEGHQTVTISTHSNPDYWNSKEQYEAMRTQLSERMFALIEQHTPGFRSALVHSESGAPLAWQHYTGRPNGYVGGFAQTLDAALFNAISHHSGLPGLYVCGDHIFPGGGTIGAAASGIHCARSISGKALLT